MNKKTDRIILELATQVSNLETAVRNQQSAPPVNDLWSGIVALFRSDALDGKVGAGSIMVSVGLSGAGFVIGGIGAFCFSATGTPWEQSGTFWEYCTRAGCYLGIFRLGMDALAVPVMWSEFLDWAHDTIIDSIKAWRGDEEEVELEPTNTRDLPINHSKGTVHSNIPEASQFEYNTRTFSSCNTESGERVVSTDKLCAYLKFITNVGERRKDYRPDYINQKEWPDVRDWFKLKGWWNLPRNSPALPQACAEIRGTVTNANRTTGTNGGTG